MDVFIWFAVFQFFFVHLYAARFVVADVLLTGPTWHALTGHLMLMECHLDFCLWANNSSLASLTIALVDMSCIIMTTELSKMLKSSFSIVFEFCFKNSPVASLHMVHVYLTDISFAFEWRDLITKNENMVLKIMATFGLNGRLQGVDHFFIPVELKGGFILAPLFLLKKHYASPSIGSWAEEV